MHPEVGQVTSPATYYSPRISAPVPLSNPTVLRQPGPPLGLYGLPLYYTFQVERFSYKGQLEDLEKTWAASEYQKLNTNPPSANTC